MICLKTLISAAPALLMMDVVSAAATSANTSSAASFTPIVDLGYSIYQGTSLANGQNQWLGIRYGAPPTFNNRFRRPQLPFRTSGIQSARSFGHVCYGQERMIDIDPNIYGEDCLFMNIWGPSTGSGLPVFFWLTGGAYIRKANANYNGTGLVTAAGNNMIFISVNYRVGPFGFLASEGVRANGDLNAGLYDQRAALEWVQNHITKFGGDPTKVVVVGESAGAGSTAMHLITRPDLRMNLFAGLIGLSPFFPTQFFPFDLQWQFDMFAQGSGCASSLSSLDKLACLRRLPAASLQMANVMMIFPGRLEPALTTWGPTIDGVLVPDIPFKLFAEGKFKAVPSIWGVDTDEGTLFAPNASNLYEVKTFLQDNYPRLTDDVTYRILSYYGGLPPNPLRAPYFPVAAESYADVTFNCPGFDLSTLMARVAPTWNYRYNVPTDQGIRDGTGVYHMAELPLLFGVGNTPLPFPGISTLPIEPVLQTYYTNFVRFLNPNTGYSCSPCPTWPRWTNQLSGSRLVFQVNNTTTELLTYNQNNRCRAWSQSQTQFQQ